MRATSGSDLPSFMLATCSVDGAPTPVVVVDGRHHPLAELVPELLVPPDASGMMQVLGRWEAAEPVLVTAVDELRSGARSCRDLGAPTEATGWLTPLQYPAKVICAGANYYDHVTKDGGHASFSKEDNIPVFFLKPPTTTLVGQGPVRFPAQTQKLDYEIELAFVVGEGGRNIRVEDAHRHVAGYTVAVDLSARDWQRHPKHLVKFDLFGGKAFDDSCPLGPGIVPARYVDTGNLQLRLWVNGELRQDANTADMIWPPRRAGRPDQRARDARARGRRPHRHPVRRGPRDRDVAPSGRRHRVRDHRPGVDARGDRRRRLMTSRRT